MSVSGVRCPSDVGADETTEQLGLPPDLTTVGASSRGNVVKTVSARKWVLFPFSLFIVL